MNALRIQLVALFILLAIPLSGCGRHRATAPTSPANAGIATTRLAPRALAGAQHLEGSIGPGSTYFLDVPPDWNRDLVVYAHGIVLPPDAPVGQPAYTEVRDSLLARGFAVAASSFDRNGYALKDGFLRTQQVKGLFISRFGPPARTYLVGRSLGGIIVQKLVETFPGQYAGALSVSGVLGGSRTEVDYVGTLRVLFDYFTPPGFLPGTAVDVPPVPPADFFNVYAPKIVNFLSQHPDALMAIVALMEGRLQGNSPQEYVQGIVLALAFQLLDDRDIMDQTHGHVPFDNSKKVYASPLLPQSLLDDLNARVARFTATPDAIAYLEQYYEPSGDLLVPMVTIHNARDPQVPSWHEDLYRTLVDGRGHGDNLFRLESCPTCQNPLQPFGHDLFTANQIATGFQILVNWVENGVEPTASTP